MITGSFTNGRTSNYLFKNVDHKLDLRTAIERDELVPVRCIRIKTNIDLTNVRFNGIKYNFLA